MRKQMKSKPLIMILLSTIFLIGVAIYIMAPHGEKLKASNGEALVKVHVDGKDVTDGKFETDQENVSVEIKAKETGIYQLPVDDSLYQIEIIRIEKSEEIPYQVMDESEFNVETELSILKNAEKVAISSDVALDTEEPSISKIIQGTNPDNDTKGTLYLVLQKDKNVTLNFKNILSESKEITLSDSNNKERTQHLISFVKRGTKESTNKEETQTNSTANVKKDISKETSQESSTSKDNKKDTSKGKKITKDKDSSNGLPISMDDIQLKGGNTDVDFKDLKLKIRTGESNFDPDDLPGHDSSPTNTIVRTWDKISYGYSFSVESKKDKSKKYTNIRYRLDANLKDARKRVDGQLRDYAYFPEGMLTGNNASETRESNYTLEGYSGTTGIVDAAVNLQILGATHNYEIKPTIVIKILEVTDIDTGEIIEVNSSSDELVNQSIKVSAKPNVKAELAKSKDSYNLMSTLTGVSTYNAMAQGVGIKFSIVPLTDAGINRTGSLYDQLFGATYPTGEIKVKVETDAYFQPLSGLKHIINYGTDQKQPEVVFYGLLDRNNYSTDLMIKTPEFNGNTFKKMGMTSIWEYMPGSKDISSGKNDTSYVYDTNQGEVKNTSKNTLTFTVTNPAAIHRDDLVIFGSPTTENASRSTFASIATLMCLPYDYKLNKNGTLYTNFNTTEITYEGRTSSNNSKYVHQNNNILPGSIINYTTVQKDDGTQIGSNPSRWWIPDGDGAVYEKQKVWAHGIYDGMSLDMKYVTGITAWNANSFEYDTSRSIQTYHQASQSAEAKAISILYGVQKGGKDTPRKTNISYDVMNGDYTWYSSYTSAKSAGVISAVKTVFEKTGIEATVKARTRVPLIAIGPGNNQAKDQFGNENVFISSSETSKSDKKRLLTYPVAGHVEVNYQATKYDTNNNLSSYHTPPGIYGETILIVPFTTRIEKKAVKTGYSSDEVIQWKLIPRVEADADDNIKLTFTDKLPKELTYLAGSTSYGGNNVEPSIKKESDGSTTLVWKVDYHKMNAPLKELQFDTVVNGKNIVYQIDNTAKVTNKAIIVGESDSGLKDTSIEKLRNSEASTTITKISTTVIDKTTTTAMIELGNQDDALASDNKEKNTTLKYTLYNKNESKSIASDTKILDVLPSATDGRGTTYTGSYELKNIKAISSEGSTGKIFYTKQNVASSTEPNDVSTSSGWSVYTSGSISNVKAIYIEYDSLEVGEELEVEVELIPKGQKTGDLFINSVKLDNYNHTPVESVHVKTRAASRSIQGFAWYDDNMDGKKDSSETLAKDIPVKLYRTSHDNKSYKNELVKQSLTGLKFIDPSGDSLVKTSASGEYKFENLPEGDYVAYFEIDGQVVAQNYKVTKKDTVLSSQAENTSKADTTTYMTDIYTTPTISSGQFDGNHLDIKNINLGLIRQSRVRLFKFETGTAVDADGDGQLNDAEKATGKALANATFDIYKGDMEEKIGTATTDSSGYLEFDKLYAGDYTLVETKAPSGYELIKNQINVTITEGNQDIVVYQDDNPATKLPFTGGNGPLLAILLTASCALVLGFGYMLWYYRTPKKKGVR